MCVICSQPPTHMGIHQALVCETSPWESHPCRVLRQLRREVSLTLKRFMAISVAVGYFRMVRKRSPPCFPLLPGWAGGSWRTFIRLGLSPPLRNVPDECLLSFQRSLGHFSPHSFTATSKAKKRHLFFQSYKIFCFSIPAQKAKALRTLSKGFGIEMPKSKKRDPLPHSVVSPLRSYANYCAAMRDYTFLAVQMEIEW